MNKQLSDLYTSKWNGLCSAIKPILQSDNSIVKPTNPLLLYLANEGELENADIRVMFFGQETNSWHKEFGTDINSTLEYYDSFFNKEGYRKRGGQFWNGFRRFKSLLSAKFPDKKIRYVWNNIVKIGKTEAKGSPPESIYSIERNHFSVIKEEINIVNPNVILFLTGPKYDRFIADNFGQLIYKPLAPFSKGELAKVELNGIDFAFRTYHPNFLWRNGIDNFYQTIINEIKF